MTDEIFDPEIHAVDKDGNPSLNKDGSFRKKRRDAGRKSSGGPAVAAAPSGSSKGKRGQYEQTVGTLAGTAVTLASLGDPVLGYALGEVVPMWQRALGALAMENPRVAAALDKAGSVGAVSDVVGAAVVTVMQVGMLLRKPPPIVEQAAGALGVKSRAEIERLLEQRGAQLRAQAEAEARIDAEVAAEAARLVEERRAAEAGAEGGHGYAAAV